MLLTCVHVRVKAEHVADFIAATTRNHLGSVQELGNLRFDIAQAEADPCVFLLYEAYRTQADADAHKQTEHYLTWRTEVEPWMAEPRRAVRHELLLPTFG